LKDDETEFETTNEPVINEPKEIDLQGQGSDSEGQRLFFNGYNHYRSRRSVGHAVELEPGEADSNSDNDISAKKDGRHDNVTFSVEFSIEAEADDDQPITKTMQTDLMYKLLDIKYEVNKEGLGINTSTQLVADTRMDIVVAFVTNCTVGQILLSEDYSSRCGKGCFIQLYLLYTLFRDHSDLMATRDNFDLLMATRDNFDLLMATRDNCDLLIVTRDNCDLLMATKDNCDLLMATRDIFSLWIDGHQRQFRPSDGHQRPSLLPIFF
jgi:hypothetical protein